MTNIQIQEARVQRLALEVYYSGKRDFYENLQDLKIEMERLEFYREFQQNEIS